jgi:uncharacterized OsmC-like protein
MVTFKLHSKGEGVCQEIQMEGSSHLINVDAAPVFGGKDQYPSPMAYVLGALTPCSQVTAQLVAKDFDIELHSFKFDLAADLDTAILCGGAKEGNPNFQTIDVNAVVETNAPNHVFKKFCKETERRCPLYQLFQRSGSDIKYNRLQRTKM